MNVILDYNVGNLESVQNGFKRVGIDSIISKDPEIIKQAKSLILPGVGAFNESMTSLQESGLIPYIKEHVKQNKLLLGICLGMQLLYEKSYEFGEHEGLGFLEGEIIPIKEDVKVPHMGWNNLKIVKDSPITKYIKNDDYVYFVHSYYVKSSNKELIASTTYGDLIPAIVGKNNVFGTQFHPEKSSQVGLNILKAYGEMIHDYTTSN